MTRRSFEIAWAPSAQRDLDRLPEKVAVAVIEFAYGSLADAPQQVGGELHFDLAGHRSARRGDFRIICRIDEEQRRVHISAIGHRGDIYRRR